MTRSKNACLGPHAWARALSLVATLACLALPAMAADTDGDVMSDAYEVFFQLNPTNPADGPLNYDTDLLVNSNEAALWTDPWEADTDRDGFDDDADTSPLSRAFVGWGEPLYTSGDDFVYTWPPWFVAAYRASGLWQTNVPTAWYVSAATSNNTGSLRLEVSRATLTNDAVLALSYFDSTNGFLYADLYDSNDVVVATNLLGNLITGGNAATVSNLAIPFGSHPTAVGIRLRRVSGDITVYESLLYVDRDFDALDAEQESQMGTSDLDSDSDNDGLDDGVEVFGYGTDPADADTDNDGMSDGLEVYHGRNPLLANTFAGLPFVENFETNTCVAGLIQGQNGWAASPTNAGSVQTNRVYAGVQALAVETGTNFSTQVSQLFENPGEPSIWTDYRLFVLPAEIPTGTVTDTAVLLFDEDGYLVVNDGAIWLTLTNQPAAATGTWVRITVNLDYAAQQWQIALDGTLMADELDFGTAASTFSGFTLDAGDAYADDIVIDAEVPGDLDLDEDSLLDWWEQQYFGDLDEAPGGDFDGDGLTNADEYALGTNPAATDSDGDGMADAVELLHGNDPAVSDAYSLLPFVEGFETNTCAVSPVDGQNNWSASPMDAAFVQTNVVFSGDQALEIAAADDESAEVAHLFGSEGAAAVWVDYHVQAIAAETPAGAESNSAALFVNTNGNLVVSDGGAWEEVALDPPLAVTGEWLRVTVQLDYDAQEWLVCLDGVIVVGGLNFAAATPEFSALQIDAGEAYADEITISTNMPGDISLDYDHLPDLWELQHFGDLDEVDAGDPDGDGFSNLAEYLAGTDPTEADADGDGLSDWYEVNVSGTDPFDADSDGDGLGDAWELRYGLDPNVADDPGADPDGDGLTNAQEEALGTNPFLADSDGDGVPDGADPQPLVADQDTDPTGPGLTIDSPKYGEFILW